MDVVVNLTLAGLRVMRVRRKRRSERLRLRWEKRFVENKVGLIHR